METRPSIMTVGEVARYMRVHTMTIYRMIRRGDLPAVRVGHGWRFRRDQIERWLAANGINADHAIPDGPRPRRSRHGRAG